jgi:hypothetical protein
MMTAQTVTLVFKDEAGEYYLLPQETLERGRVPAEHTTALEAQLAAMAPAAAEGDDVQGYLRCEDARRVAGIYSLTGQILIGLSDYDRAYYYSGVSSGMLQGACR